MKLLIIGTCLGLASCTPIEREITEEAVEVFIEYEKGAKAPEYVLMDEDRTGAFIKNDDTSRSYRNKRQYPQRKRDNSDNTPISKLPKRGM